jgi:hypothetical protein
MQTAPQRNEPPLLSQKEFAYALQVTVRTIRKYRQLWPKQLKPAKALGGQLFWSASVVPLAQELVTKRAFKRYGIE